MRNIQISLNDASLTFIDGEAESAQKTRAALIREAVELWIRRKGVERFEDRWIAALKAGSRVESPGEADAWLAAEAWDKP